MGRGSLPPVFYTLTAALMEREEEQSDLSKYAAVWYDTREEMESAGGDGRATFGGRGRHTDILNFSRKDYRKPSRCGIFFPKTHGCIAPRAIGDSETP